MTALVFILTCLAGGVGAACRYLLDSAIMRRAHLTYPVGTTVINVTGALVLGFVTALASDSILTPDLAVVIGGGLLGGYTTFSTASVETVRLIENRRWLAGIANGVGMLVLAVAAAALGVWFGSLV
ncbi:fluoride efflux transporter CrcB [Paramicrobacterium sp. CJ85]|uniref:fluoride efflux transporter CrcB n=1 Tax=Paramicrobacterium sp. CJ85 TaxID=3445355 RepID=UPI003F60943E